MQPSSNISVTSKLYKTRYSRIWGKSGEMYVDADGDGDGCLLYTSDAADE